MRNKLYLCLTILFSILIFSASATSQIRTASVTGNWSNTATWGGQSVPTSTDSVIINAGITVTVNQNADCKSLTIIGGTTTTTVTVNSSLSLNITNVLTFNYSNSASVSGLITGAGSVSAANLDVGNDVTPSSNTTLTHVLTSSIGSMTLSGDLAIRSSQGSGLRRANGTFILSSGTLTINGSLKTVNANSNNISTFTNASGSQNGVLILNGSVPIDISAAGTSNIDTDGTGTTVSYTGPSQSIMARTYQNLVLGGNGVKTIPGSAVVNGILSIEGTATISAAPNYGAGATLRYNSSSPRNAGSEWVTPFTSAGGIVIENTGSVTLTGPKQVGNNISLTITDGANLNTNNFNLTIGGNLNISGSATMTSNSAVTISGTTNYNTSGTTTLSAATTFSTAKYSQTNGTFNSNGNEISITGSGASVWAKAGGIFTGTAVFTGSNPEVSGEMDNVSVNVGNSMILSGNTTVNGTAGLNNGKIVVGSNVLKLSGPVDFNGCTIGGSDNSELIIDGSGDITGELIVNGQNKLKSLSTTRNVTAGNNIVILEDLTLDNGSLNFNSTRLRIQGGLNVTGGALEGNLESELFIEGSGDLSLPPLTVDQLRIDRDGNVTTTGAVLVNRYLRVIRGNFITGTDLTMNKSNVFITDGSLSGSPVFNDKLNVYYYNGEINPLETGSELANQDVQSISFGRDAGVTLGTDISVNLVTVKSGEVNIDDKTMTLTKNASYVREKGGILTGTTGKVSITSGIANNIVKNPGELGAVFTTRKKMGSTTLERGFEAQFVDGNPGIKRYYNITPTVTNTDIDFEFNYHESELNGNIEESLQLYISTDDGTTWNLLGDGGTVDAGNNKITVRELVGVNAILGRVTAKGPIGLDAPVVNNNEDPANEEKSNQEKELRGVKNSNENNISLKDEESELSELTEIELIPDEVIIDQNYPNPFNPVTNIKFALPESDFVSVKVFDITGREIAELVNGNMNAGFHTVQFNGANLSSGIYFYKITTGSGFNHIMKMSLIK